MSRLCVFLLRMAQLLVCFLSFRRRCNEEAANVYIRYHLVPSKSLDSFSLPHIVCRRSLIAGLHDLRLIDPTVTPTPRQVRIAARHIILRLRSSPAKSVFDSIVHLVHRDVLSLLPGVRLWVHRPGRGNGSLREARHSFLHHPTASPTSRRIQMPCA